MNRFVLLLIPLLAACSSGKAAIGADTGGVTGGITGDDTGAGGNITDGADGTDGTDGGGGGDTGPTDSPYMGTWSGPTAMEVPDWGWVLCEGEGDLEVDATGSATGSPSCDGGGGGGGGGDMGFPLEVVGSIDEAGTFTGTVSFEVRNRDGGTDLVELDLTGAVDGANLLLSWTDVIPAGGGGETADLVGSWDLQSG